VENAISRKKFFRNAAQYAAGVVAGAVGFNIITSRKSEAQSGIPPLPWTYAALDPETTRKLGHEYTYAGGCAYGGFASIHKQLQEKVGEPFTGVPAHMMTYGGGGVKGWGTLCGALNGACAAIGLVLDKEQSKTVIDELMYWYTKTLLPTDISNEYGANKQFNVDKYSSKLPQSISDSPLCHVSLTRWCNTFQYIIDSPEQLERCSRLSGDVAAKAVQLLNDHFNNRFQAEFTQSESIAECLECHGKGNDIANVASKQDCTPCHGDPHQ